jgi:hypothetical protein
MKTFKEMTANQKAYREFFDKKLAKWKVKSPAELSDEDKKKFYNEIEKEWDKDKDEGLAFDKVGVKLSEAKSLEFYGEDDNYVIAHFEYEGKDYSIMARGKDWKYAWEAYEGEQDNTVYESGGRNYKDMVNKISKWVKKFTKGKFAVKFPKEDKFEKEVSYGPKYDD